MRDNPCNLIFSSSKLENRLKKHVRDVTRMKYGFVKLVVILFFCNTRCDYVILSEVQEIQNYKSTVLLSISYSSLSRLLNFMWIQLSQWSHGIALWDLLTVFRQTLHTSVIVDNIKAILSQLQKWLKHFLWYLKTFTGMAKISIKSIPHGWSFPIFN